MQQVRKYNVLSGKFIANPTEDQRIERLPMKHKKIIWICFLLACTMVLSSLGCTKARKPSASVEAEHFHQYAKEVFAPSCMEKGYSNYICDCGHTYIADENPALGHSYKTIAIPPLANHQGCTLSTCIHCGNSYQDAFRLSAGASPDYLLPFMKFSRERKYDPEFVMIHFTSAVVLSQNDPYNMDTIRRVFTDYEVSVHYIIARNGAVHCYIPENLVAYHAGYGTWENDPKYTDLLNEYAIGIELVAIGSEKDMEQYLSADAYNSLDPSLIGYTDAQYDALKQLVGDICQRNNIPMDREHIIGHEEYSPQKTDPGELFDWDRIIS